MEPKKKQKYEERLLDSLNVKRFQFKTLFDLDTCVELLNKYLNQTLRKKASQQTINLYSASIKTSRANEFLASYSISYMYHREYVIKINGTFTKDGNITLVTGNPQIPTRTWIRIFAMPLAFILMFVAPPILSRDLFVLIYGGIPLSILPLGVLIADGYRSIQAIQAGILLVYSTLRYMPVSEQASNSEYGDNDKVGIVNSNEQV